ncbi:MAG TPA: porin [Planctomycetota bacterium]|nr:porin [Planctomycetota bacterium]
MMNFSIARRCFGIAALSALAFAASAADSEMNMMRNQIEQLRMELNQVRAERYSPPPQDVIQGVDTSVHRSWEQCNTDCGGLPVTTRHGKLVIGGLVQVWYQAIQNDSRGWENGPAVLGSSPAPFGNNQTRDNDTFRVRRAELTFDMCLTEQISSHVRIDPAAQALGFPGVPSNQAPFFNAGFANVNSAQAQAGQNCPAGTLCNAGIGNQFNDIVRNGGCDACNLLEEAYINYHDLCWLPCHDIQVGEMKRKLGEEGTRDNGMLDFCERAMITQIADDYDLGLQIHGSFFCDRLQYWAGVFDGAGTAFQSRSNRPDDNDAKDVTGTIMGRPFWDSGCWGSLELGYSGLIGRGGESAGNDPITNPSPGLNERPTVHSNQYAWIYYAPGAAASGLWFRGEYGTYRDRFAPGQVVTGLFNYTNDPQPFNIQGWYGAVGYKLCSTPYAQCLPCWAKPFEFAYRHEVMGNLFYENLADPNRKVNVFNTSVDTVGVNYYLKDHLAKIQVNYNFVHEQHNGNTGDRQVREVRNDNLVVSFSVMF